MQNTLTQTLDAAGNIQLWTCDPIGNVPSGMLLLRHAFNVKSNPTPENRIRWALVKLPEVPPTLGGALAQVLAEKLAELAKQRFDSEVTTSAGERSSVTKISPADYTSAGLAQWCLERGELTKALTPANLREWVQTKLASFPEPARAYALRTFLPLVLENIAASNGAATGLQMPAIEKAANLLASIPVQDTVTARLTRYADEAISRSTAPASDEDFASMFQAPAEPATM